MRRPVIAGAVAGAVLLGGGGIAFAHSQGSSGHYRTATATLADVDSTLSLSGTVASSARRDLTFGTDGEVRSVKVSSGDEVKSGDVLATLDPTDLDAAVTRAEATLAKATAQLESDSSSQSATVSSAAESSAESATGKNATSSARSSSTSPPRASDSSAVTKALATLKKQQAAVTEAQTAATEAITAAKSAVTARADACAADDDAATDDDAETDEPGTDQPDGACADALAAAQDAQDVVAEKQDALQKALQDLNATLTAAVKSLGSNGSGSGGTPSGGSSSGTTGGATSGGGGGVSGGSASAGSLAKDQAAIDTAKAELTEAKLARRAASLTAPFDGTVLEVSAVQGDSVSSTDVAVILVGDGGSTVTTTVTVDQVAQVEKGQTAQVTPAGFDEPVEGTVSEIGMLPSSGDDSTTYPVTIDLADDVSAPEGAGASITLITGTAKGAVSVPSSAVTTTGTRSSVTVLKNGSPTTVAVTVGVVGSTRTSITDGLTKGQDVVLADLDASLPSSDTVDQRSFGNGGAGFGGGGMGRPGGPPGR